MSKIIISSLLLFINLFFASCGGDEEESSIDPALDATENEVIKEEIPDVEEVVKKVPVEAPKEERKIPNPNGVYLPTGEEKKKMANQCMQMRMVSPCGTTVQLGELPTVRVEGT